MQVKAAEVKASPRRVNELLLLGRLLGVSHKFGEARAIGPPTNHRMVVRRVRDLAEDRRRMPDRRPGAGEKLGSCQRDREVVGEGLGDRINQAIGSPISDCHGYIVRKQAVANSRRRKMSWHPDERLVGDKVLDASIKQCANEVPQPGERPGSHGCRGQSALGDRAEREAVRPHSWHEVVDPKRGL